MDTNQYISQKKKEQFSLFWLIEKHAESLTRGRKTQKVFGLILYDLKRNPNQQVRSYPALISDPIAHHNLTLYPEVQNVFYPLPLSSEIYSKKSYPPP